MCSDIGLISDDDRHHPMNHHGYHRHRLNGCLRHCYTNRCCASCHCLTIRHRNGWDCWNVHRCTNCCYWNVNPTSEIHFLNCV